MSDLPPSPQSPIACGTLTHSPGSLERHGYGDGINAVHAVVYDAETERAYRVAWIADDEHSRYEASEIEADRIKRLHASASGPYRVLLFILLCRGDYITPTQAVAAVNEEIARQRLLAMGPAQEAAPTDPDPALA